MATDAFIEIERVRKLENRLIELEQAIIAHHQATSGQGMCWENDFTLWCALGVRVCDVDHRPPNWLAFLLGCIRYRWSRRGCPRCCNKGAD